MKGKRELSFIKLSEDREMENKPAVHDWIWKDREDRVREQKHQDQVVQRLVWRGAF